MDNKAKPLTPGMKMLMDGGGATSFFKKLIPLKSNAAPKLGTTVTPTESPAPVSLVRARALPVLGQTQEAGAPAALPEPPAEAPKKCPGPVALPDGRILEPGDYIRLEDLCEIMPYLLNAMKSSMGVGQQVRVAGGIPGVQGVPAPNMFGGTGGPLGPYATAAAGGGFGGGGGGGGSTGPRGPAGATGPQGPAGSGSAVETPVIKTDGNFSAGAGAFVPVPGTSITFTMDADGVAIVYGMITGGSGISDASQNFQLGLRIDGTDYPLNLRCIHTFAGGVGEFFIPANIVYPISLGAGAHTVELLLRGLTLGEYGGVGLGSAGNVQANTDNPLIMAVSH
jgi:hypothetical protein